MQKSDKKTTSNIATKKVTKTAKKGDTKKSPLKELRKLNSATGSECFWTADGLVLANLLDLGNAFKSMSIDTYRHHANTEKNDFAQWVEDILGDKECATGLKKAKTVTSARRAVLNALKSYKA